MQCLDLKKPHSGSNFACRSMGSCLRAQSEDLEAAIIDVDWQVPYLTV